MTGVVEVYLWGTKIGALGYEPNQTEFATFEYDKEFLKMGIEISPIYVPTTKNLYTFDTISHRTFHGLPGFIADALPDKFGNQLIDQYFASKGQTPEDITALDRLLYVGNRAMGALEFRPSIQLEKNNSNIELKLHDLSQLAEMILSKKESLADELKGANRETAINLLRIGSSAGGARSKALVAIDKEGKLYDGTVNQRKKCSYYLLKFDNSSNSDRDHKDPKGMTRIEYIYSLFAKECEINIPKTDYIEDGNDFHFLIERFDRSNKDKGTSKNKIHYVSWCGIAHAHRDETGAYSYEQLILTARQLQLGQDTIIEIFKRAVFNLVGRNQDDHTKNFGFLMNRDGQWSLSPAFDMTYSYDPTGKWTNTHQIKLNGKQDDFTKDDILSFGKFCGLKDKYILETLNKTISVFSNFDTLAIKYNVDEKLKNTVSKNLRVKF
jgi:serine/threonine-protein kinase HipA